MRMFVAITLPEAVKEHLAEFLEPRQQAGFERLGLRWTLPAQWHVTLAFLPKVTDRHTDELSERLQRAASRRKPLEARLVGAGAFPNPDQAKVLWAGLEHEGEELTRLAGGVRAAAAKSGIELDGARFHPHLTLARLGKPGDANRLLRVLESYDGPSWQAVEVALIESHLGQGPNARARHEVLQTFRLGAPGMG